MGLVPARDTSGLRIRRRLLHEGATPGQFEKDSVLGEVVEEADPAPISMEAAFARLKKIATIRTVLVAFCALGFGLFSQHTLASDYLNNNLHVTSLLQRGVLLALGQVFALPLLPFVAIQFDKILPAQPRPALALVGLLIIPSAIFTPLQFRSTVGPGSCILGIPQGVLTTAAFAMVGPAVYAVLPYRLRGMGAALSTMYIFFIGASPARSSPASSPMPSAPATPSSSSACPPASSVDCCS